MIDIGDYIQWECNGMMMFKELKRVRDFSPCERFLFVEGETCGLPVAECTKIVTFKQEQVMDEKFTFFWSGPFSQWTRCSFKVDGITYNCTEQFMMAEKARFFSDKESEKEIMRADHPSDQKRLGRNVKGFIKDKWDKVAKNIVYRGNLAKFKQNPKLREHLFATKGTTLVEASPVDQIWGIGLKENDERALKRSTWKGKNWLGETLTKVREDMMKE